MTFDDLKKLATSTLLFSLDRIIAPRLITILYLLGLAAIVLWTISHLFATFAFGFGAGLWGLLEIAVFGLLGFVVLRIVCEALIVYFKANEGVATTASHPRPSVSLIDEVRDAIEELADDDYEAEPAPAPAKPRAAAKPAAAKTPATKTPARPRRTAKRTPPTKS
ncbi:DUF4282 domain-containing protein [Mariluticola halotolerans]|uniref:DUF4282 domain-containing protein n=1 Tax=Mariluticola halotolerans TaxID=2909283 RepID=UPI0026E2FFD0|nr:DUF4282 domain-containing protein [Mariluticola halotolerans]UJQ95251.1 DUF4282 domain-containing protein [Mariluticola halotolerans]